MNYFDKRSIAVFIGLNFLATPLVQADSLMNPVDTLQGDSQKNGAMQSSPSSALLSPAPAPSAVPDQEKLVKERISRYGEIVGKAPMAGPFTAWVVEKNGKQLTLYATPSADMIFAGVVWDGVSGKNITSDYTAEKVAAASMQNVVSPNVENSNAGESVSSSEVQTSAEKPVAALDGWFNGTIPPSMKAVDSLAGFKEGNGGIADTLYVIVDPRCPYCRKAFNLTREYVKQGRTIKWIPALALGQDEKALSLAASILQDNTIETTERVLGRHENLRAQPSAETRKALAMNLDFMFAAFDQNKVEAAGVPVAFFLDHRTGKARMMTGVSESVVLEDIFGKI